MADPLAIAVVGSGVVGLATALHLSRTTAHNISIIAPSFPQRFPQHEQPESWFTANGKAVYLNHASEHLLERLGIDSEAKNSKNPGNPESPKYKCPVDAISLWDSGSTGNIHFSAKKESLSDLGSIWCEQYLCHRLSQIIEQEGSINRVTAEVQDTTNSEAGRVLELTATQMTVDLVIACDGANSLLAQQAGVLANEHNLHQTAIVGKIRTDVDHSRCASQWFTEDGTLGLLPLPDSKEYSMIWSVDDRLAERHNRNQSSQARDIIGQVEQITEGLIGKVTSLEQVRFFPIHQQIRQYCSTRLVLLGDAAHSIHPMAGQGLNLALAAVDEVGRDLVHADNDSLHATLQGHAQSSALRAQRLAQLASVLLRLFRFQSPLARFVRARGMGTVQHVPQLKSLIVQLAQGEIV